MNSQNGSNRNNQPLDDPLGQLNRFHQNIQPNQPANHTPNQSGNNHQEKHPSKPTDQNEKRLKSWWEEWRQTPFVQTLRENKKWLWIVGGALAACVCLLLMIFAMNDSTDVIEEFEMAIVDEDKEKLKDLLESDDSSLEIDDAFLEKLLEYSSENDWFVDLITRILRGQKSIYEEDDEKFDYYISPIFGKIESFDKGELTKKLFMDETSDFKIYLKENTGISRIFGPDYVIGVRPTYIKISLSDSPTQVLIDEKPVELKKGAKEQIIGPYLPGEYTIKAAKKYPFALVIDEKEVNLFSEKQTVSVEFDLTGEKVTFESDIEGTELLIDNQSTKTTVGQDGKEFGPVSTDGDSKAVGQFTSSWGTIKSDPIPISTGKVNITPNPLSNPQIKAEVVKRINDYAKERVEAQKKKDGTLFTSLDENLKSRWINNMADRREYRDNVYKGEAVKTVIAVKKATITESDKSDTFKIKVPVQFHWRERNYGAWDDGDEPLVEAIKERYTWLTYNSKEKRWEISELNPIFFSQDLFKDSSVVTTNFK